MNNWTNWVTGHLCSSTIYEGWSIRGSRNLVRQDKIRMRREHGSRTLVLRFSTPCYGTDSRMFCFGKSKYSCARVYTYLPSGLPG